MVLCLMSLESHLFRTVRTLVIYRQGAFYTPTKYTFFASLSVLHNYESLDPLWESRILILHVKLLKWY